MTPKGSRGISCWSPRSILFPFRLVLYRSRSFPLRRLTTSRLCLCRPWYYGRRIREIYPEGGYSLGVLSESCAEAKQSHHAIYHLA